MSIVTIYVTINEVQRQEPMNIEAEPGEEEKGVTNEYVGECLAREYGQVLYSITRIVDKVLIGPGRYLRPGEYICVGQKVSSKDSNGGTGVDITPSKRDKAASQMNLLEDIIKQICESGIGLFLNGSALSVTSNLTDILCTSECQSKPMDDLSDYLIEGTAAVIEDKVNMQNLLSAKRENRAQAALSQVCELLDASDTSSNSNCMFSHSRKVYATSNIYPASAKLDLISNSSPLGLELKATLPTKNKSTSLVSADVAGLAQALQRTYVIRSTDATLSSFVLIVITGRSAWHVRFDRNLPKYGSTGFETVNVHRIAHEDVWKIWLAYNNLTAKKPNWFLTHEALHVRSVLSCFTVPSLCATRLIAKSKHHVYGVSLPQAVPFRTVGNVNKTVLGVTLLRFDFCIKVIPSNHHFGTESTIATAVGDSYNAMFPDRRHYLLRTHSMMSANSTSDAVSSVTDDMLHMDLGSDLAVDTTDNPLLYEAEDENGELEAAAVTDTTLDLVKLAQFRKLQMLSQRQVVALARRSCDYADKCKWRCSEEADYRTVNGGSLLMTFGQLVSPNTVDVKMHWVRGVHESLQATHQAGFYHCDVRPGNVLLFGDHYQLIDYDSAVDQREPEFLLVEGDQYNLRPASLAGATIGSAVIWSALLDAEMTSVCLLRFQDSK